MKTRYTYSPLKRFKDWLTGPFHSASTRLVRHLRSKGVKVGDGVVFRDAKSVTIDLTRPSLIEIGDNVDKSQFHNYDSRFCIGSLSK